MSAFVSLVPLLAPGLIVDAVTNAEVAFTLLALLTAPYLSNAGERISRVLSGALTHRLFWIFFAGVLALGLHCCVVGFLPLRAPAVHDEFSYLLMSDTFLQGRLSNPPHPLWEFFETAHVNHHPYYASMYPPAQGLVLAAGKILTGHEIGGPWLASAALASVLTWAIGGWLPMRWAAFAGILAAIRIGAFSYWANSYWGGAVVAIGGALQFGSVPRLAATRQIKQAILFGVGAVILLLSRPFEGLIYSAISASALCYLIRDRKWTEFRKPFMAAAVVGALGLAFSCYYNWRQTGEIAKLGYQVNMERYGLAVFPWAEAGHVQLPRAEHLAEFYREQWETHKKSSSSIEAFLARQLARIGVVWAFFIGPLLTVPLAASIWKGGFWRQASLMLAMMAGFGLLTAANLWAFPHYFSPATALIYCIVTMALMSFWDTRVHGLSIGRGFVCVLPVLCLAIGLAGLRRGSLSPSADPFFLPWHRNTEGNVTRSQTLHSLEQIPGHHLVLVSYDPGHASVEEWVYNAADIDAARVIWAHDFGPDQNRTIINYYCNRRVWRIRVSDRDAHIEELVSGERRCPGSLEESRNHARWARTMETKFTR